MIRRTPSDPNEPRDFERKLIASMNDYADSETPPRFDPDAIARSALLRRHRHRATFQIAAACVAVLAAVGLGVGLADRGHQTASGGLGTTPTAVPTPTSSGGVCVPITSANAPVADPAALARVTHQGYGSFAVSWSNSQLNLIALVDQAARADDIPRLEALGGCAQNTARGQQQLVQWRQPGVLAGLAKVLEQTHGAAADGIVFPGFRLAGWNEEYAATDLAALGVGSAGEISGIGTDFTPTPGGGMTWGGTESFTASAPTGITAEVDWPTGTTLTVGSTVEFSVTLSNYTGGAVSDVAPSVAVVYGGDSSLDHDLKGTLQEWNVVSGVWEQVPFPYPPLAAGGMSVPSSGVPLGSGGTADFRFRVTVSALPAPQGSAPAYPDTEIAVAPMNVSTGADAAGSGQLITCSVPTAAG